MPAACRALEAWAALAGLQPRQGVFCPIDQHGHLSPRRLTGHSVSAIVQTRMRRLEHRRGKTRKDANAAAALFRGQLAARRLRDQRGCQGAAELPLSGAHSHKSADGAGLHPRKRPVEAWRRKRGRGLRTLPLQPTLSPRSSHERPVDRQKSHQTRCSGPIKMPRRESFALTLCVGSSETSSLSHKKPCAKAHTKTAAA